MGRVPAVSKGVSSFQPFKTFAAGAMKFAPQGQIPCCAPVPFGPAVLVFTLQAALADINIAKTDLDITV
jgi:hypothetical protein